MQGQQIRFCPSFDGTRIAYSESGRGQPVVLLPSWLTHLDFQQRSVAWKPWINALSERYRLIRYDPRGCGMSDRKLANVSFDAWVRDLETLAGYLKLDRFSLIGTCQGGAVAIEYAARFPRRVDRLLLFGSYARGRNKRGDLPLEPEKARVLLDMIRLGWGSEDHAFSLAFAQQFQPEGMTDHLKSWCELQRRAAAPEEAVALTEIMFEIDIRSALSIIGCPTLVVHANRDAVVPIAEGRLLASRILDARFLELDTPNHFPRPDEPAWADFVEAMHRFLPPPEAVAGVFAALTERERDVLDFLARGHDNHRIGAELGISEKTVRNHVSSVFAKLGVESRAAALVAARDVGYGREGSGA